MDSCALHLAQGELIQLVADWLLDANSPQRLGHNADNRDYMANLEQNVADAINLLPKLCTGVDVNVRFNSIKGFEFTEEVAIFDLLDISLVHGWIVDPTVSPLTLSPCPLCVLFSPHFVLSSL